MKNIIKIIGGGVGILVIIVTAMAMLNICPPQGPWAQPPWCPGSSMSWPFSDPEEQSATVEEDSITTEDEEAQTNEIEDFLLDEDISENERLARVAIGLVQDLTSVNTYFNGAASSIGEVQASHQANKLFHVSNSHSKVMALSLPGINLLQVDSQIPQGFLDPLPESGFIPAPAGACAIGASPSASFLTQDGENITPELLAENDIQVIGFDELTGGSIEGRQLESTITSLITPGDPDLLTPDGWNQKVWSKLAENQTGAASLMDYHLWSVSEQIEAVIVDSMGARMESMGLPDQIMSAFRASQTSGWYASPAPEDAYKISAMEIEAVFSGATEGTIYEKRDFSIPTLGEMPQFGPMVGEGSVVYHDPDSGDYPFDLEIDWTKWDELGRVTEGEIIFTDQEHDVVIELSVKEDNSRIAHVFRQGIKVGIVNVDSSGMISYEDLTE